MINVSLFCNFYDKKSGFIFFFLLSLPAKLSRLSRKSLEEYFLYLEFLPVIAREREWKSEANRRSF